MFGKKKKKVEYVLTKHYKSEPYDPSQALEFWE